MAGTGEAPPSPNPGGSWKGPLLAGAVGALLGAGAVAAGSGYFVRGYLLENPEIIPEAMQRLQAREEAKIVSAHRAELETPYAGAWAGASDADVVLVQFFDYACGYCRRSNPDIDRLLAEDKKLKVVWRDWPVLGPDSEAAAAASLAAAQAGKFKPFHERLFALGRPSRETVAQAQRAVGLPPERLDMTSSPAVQQELVKNHRLAQAINATGTPTFVVGDRVLQGAVGYEALKQAIAEARASG
jgi:protein-disulfide isomerase